MKSQLARLFGLFFFTVLYDATQVIQRFFHLFGHWRWPEPVTLIEIDPKNKYQQQQMEHLAASAAMASWNPMKNIADGYHVG